jgi:hypothetical protein
VEEEGAGGRAGGEEGRRGQCFTDLVRMFGEEEEREGVEVVRTCRKAVVAIISA